MMWYVRDDKVHEIKTNSATMDCKYEDDGKRLIQEWQKFSFIFQSQFLL